MKSAVPFLMFAAATFAISFKDTVVIVRSASQDAFSMGGQKPLSRTSQENYFEVGVPAEVGVWVFKLS
jgi:hypothetical protein